MSNDPNYIGEVHVSDPWHPLDGFCMEHRDMEKLKEAGRSERTIRCELPNGAVIWEKLKPNLQGITKFPIGTKIFVDPNPPPKSRVMWICKIGITEGWVNLPKAADAHMRVAVKDTFKMLTGSSAEFCFSGWGGDLTEAEKLIVEQRVPEMMDHYLFAGPGGACMASRPIEGLTQDLAPPGGDQADEERYKRTCDFYGGRYFVCETMTESGMKKLAAALGLRFKEKE